MKKTLRLILGDQLNINHSWFQEDPTSATYVIMEVKQETLYTTHHIQKIVAFFLAMRLFCEELKGRGFEVQYFSIDSKFNQHSFSENIKTILRTEEFSSFEYQEPDEWRLDKEFLSWTKNLSVPVKMVGAEHFLSKRLFVNEMFKEKNSFLMETFYREMRKRSGYLMNGRQPKGGKWNFDTENRKKLPKKVLVPPALRFERDVTDLVSQLHDLKISSMGSIRPRKFDWPVTRQESLHLLKHFVEHQLCFFGTYQDAMHSDHELLFHSRLSFALNVKLISPREVIENAIAYHESHPDIVSLSQIEGFVRQILGWREYMRGLYWAKMPEFKSLNYFKHDRALPQVYWTGKTKMNCMRHVTSQSLSTAYAHHIQRLMITGNFALLTGVDPDQVDEWYLGVYADAVEWVQITNTRGMSQFADGGIVATKPYVSSANYIHKMSNYCEGCTYERDKRIGTDACPFNSLYWNFFLRHEKLLRGNPRIGMAYQLLDRMTNEDREAIRKQAEDNITRINSL